MPAWTSIILFTHPAGHVVSFQTLNPSESYLCRHQRVPCPLDRSDSPLLHDAAGGAIDCREKTRGTKQRGDVDALLSILYPFGKLELMKTYNIIAVESRYSASWWMSTLNFMQYLTLFLLIQMSACCYTSLNPLPARNMLNGYRQDKKEQD